MLEKIWGVVIEFWGVLSEMAPYLLFGFFVAGLLSVVISPSAVERHLGRGRFWEVLKATLFGIPLPLCSCGVIPVAASLRRHGASRGATTAFLLSTPQTGVDSIFVTFSLLGPVFAIFRPLAALVTGVVGGSVVEALVKEERTGAKAPAACNAECCTGGEGKSKIVRIFRYGFLTLPQDIAKALLVGLAIAGAITVLVPKDYLGDILGTGILAMLVMMALGIPVYVCATASVPVAAALIAKGISPGAALVFLMTGPATNAATIAIIWKTLGKRTAAVYLATVAITALGFGLLLDYIFKVSGTAAAMPEMAWMLPPFVKTASAIVLLGVLGLALFWPSLSRGHPAGVKTAGGQTILLSIKGMTCYHCVESIQRALKESPGVEFAEVDLKTGRAQVRGKNLNANLLVRAVDGLGYKAAVIDGSAKKA